MPRISQTCNGLEVSQPEVVKKSGLASENPGSASDAMFAHVVAMSESARAGPAVTASAIAMVSPILMALRYCCGAAVEVIVESCKDLRLGLWRGLQTGGSLGVRF